MWRTNQTSALLCASVSAAGVVAGAVAVADVVCPAEFSGPVSELVQAASPWHCVRRVSSACQASCVYPAWD
jgi:hypothetical protein